MELIGGAPEDGGVFQLGAADEELGLHVGDARLQAALLLLLAHELPAALLQRRDGRQLVRLRPPLLLLHLQQCMQLMSQSRFYGTSVSPGAPLLLPLPLTAPGVCTASLSDSALGLCSSAARIWMALRIMSMSWDGS